MKICELHATTGYSGLIIPVRGTYAVGGPAYRILSEKAFGIYKTKVEADPERLSQYELRLCIWEKENGIDGIFRLTKTIYQDFRLINGKVVMVKEKTFNK